MRLLPPRLVAGLGAVALAAVALSALAAARVFGARYAVDWEAAGLAQTVLIGVGVALVSQVLRLRLPTGGGQARLAWGEAAVVVLCAGVPLALVTPAAAAGFGIAHAVLHVVDRRGGRPRPARETVYGVAGLVVATALAAVVVGAVRAARPGWVAGGLCLAAIVYFLMTLGLVALRIAVAGGSDVRPIARAMLRSTTLMLVGNVAVGLVVVWVSATNAYLLLLLPPVLWLLHQFYANRLGEDDERRTWASFAEVARDLNRLDERDAAEAGIAGAVRLFGVPAARVVLTAGRSYGHVPDGEPVTVRALTVGAVTVGELRLAGPEPQRDRERLMLATFGEALAAALHDAITHDQLRVMSERTTYDAVRDPLTALYNRAALLARGNVRLAARGAGDPVALLLLDVNHFKEVNNALGHTAGDEVLKVIARRVRDASGVDSGDLHARLGGDEFAILITDLAGGGADLALAAAVERARKLGAQIAAPMRIDGVTLSKETSIGVVVAEAGAVDLTELLRRADIAMYQAKDGGQPVAWYDPARDDASTDRLALLAELREAIDGADQLALELQPAVSLGGPSGPAGQITGVEALVRWQHPRRGKLMPGQFLPAAEASELIGPLTHWVLERAIALASSWRRAGLAVPVAVNISARSLAERQLPETIGEALTRHRLPAELLILEITESIMLSNSPVIDDVLARVRRLGVQLAVDDFGTGYSAFTVLTRVPVQEVKIDREFVAQMLDAQKHNAIVRATVDLGLELGLRVVAEGVETPDQRAALAELGCTAAQGFLFYPPLSPDGLLAVLRERRQVQRRHLRAEGTG